MRVQPPWVRRSAFRGKRRAFQKAIAAAEAFRLLPDSCLWWDFWHYHADWRGWGNLSWTYRRRYLEALVIVFKRIAAVGPKLSTPFQSWILLADDDAGQDATYLHTPNPNGTPFPADLGAVDWGRRLPEADFERLLPEYPLRIGLSEWLDTSEGLPGTLRRNWIAYSPAVGVPLESHEEVEQADEADGTR